MSNQLLKDAYQRKYYDVEVECHLVATVMKRVYVDEFASHVDTHFDCEHLDRYHNIIAEEVGADEFHNNNRLFAEVLAPELIETEEIMCEMETTKMFTTCAWEGEEIAGTPIWKCVICEEHFTGYDNNPDPVVATGPDNPGGCCDACNTNKVIPARMAELMQMNHLGV